MPPLRKFSEGMDGEELIHAAIDVIATGLTMEPWTELRITKDRFYDLLGDGKIVEEVKRRRKYNMFLLAGPAINLTTRALRGEKASNSQKCFAEMVLTLNGMGRQGKEDVTESKAKTEELGFEIEAGRNA